MIHANAKTHKKETGRENGKVKGPDGAIQAPANPVSKI
jgi:hypothetical protein